MSEVTLAQALMSLPISRRAVIENIARFREQGMEWDDMAQLVGVPDPEATVRETFVKVLDAAQSRDPLAYAHLVSAYSDEMDKWLTDLLSLSRKLANANKKQAQKQEATEVSTPKPPPPSPLPPLILDVLQYLVDSYAKVQLDLAATVKGTPDEQKVRRMARRGRKLSARLSGYREAVG